MKKPPPGMKSMPLKPGETKSQYMDRVRATNSTTPVKTPGIRVMDTRGPVRGFSKDPGTGAPKPRVGGGVKGGGRRSDMAPTPATSTTPRPKVGGVKGGMAPIDSGRGAIPKPKVGGSMVKPPRRMKTGGMVKGKK